MSTCLACDARAGHGHALCGLAGSGQAPNFRGGLVTRSSGKGGLTGFVPRGLWQLLYLLRPLVYRAFTGTLSNGAWRSASASKPCCSSLLSKSIAPPSSPSFCCTALYALYALSAVCAVPGGRLRSSHCITVQYRTGPLIKFAAPLPTAWDFGPTDHRAAGSVEQTSPSRKRKQCSVQIKLITNPSSAQCRLATAGTFSLLPSP